MWRLLYLRSFPGDNDLSFRKTTFFCSSQNKIWHSVDFAVIHALMSPIEWILLKSPSPRVYPKLRDAWNCCKAFNSSKVFFQGMIFSFLVLRLNDRKTFSLKKGRELWDPLRKRRRLPVQLYRHFTTFNSQPPVLPLSSFPRVAYNKPKINWKHLSELTLPKKTTL